MDAPPHLRIRCLCCVYVEVEWGAYVLKSHSYKKLYKKIKGASEILPPGNMLSVWLINSYKNLKEKIKNQSFNKIYQISIFK